MSSVFCPRTECHIQASASDVFTLLTDVSTWPEWNPFVPSAEIADTTQSTSTIMQLDSLFRFHSVVGTQKNTTSERVTIFDAPTNTTTSGSQVYRVGWKQESLPQSLMRATRVNEVEEIVGKDGPECIYRTWHDFEGPLAYPTKWAVGNKIQAGMEQMAEGLKKAAESKA